jgi:hypothetical protein
MPGFILAAIALTVSAEHGRGADVRVEVSARETYLGLPVRVQVVLENVEQHASPQFPELDGATVRSLGPPSSSQRMSIVNGRVTRESTITYAFELVPQRTGTIRVPAIRVRADGAWETTRPFDIEVVEAETGDLLLVDIKGARDSVYVGEPVKLALQVWIKPYVSRRFQLTLSERDMWALAAENSSWGIFAESLQVLRNQRQRPRGREAFREDSEGNRRSYYLYELEKTIWPERAGTLQVGDIRIVVRYPTKLVRDNSFFSMGELKLGGHRPLVQSLTTAPIEVKPIPTEKRPEIYRGAVGRYTIETTAKPTKVRVGDPITVSMVVRGEGRLDLLQAPPLAQVVELTRNFQVPDEQLAGIVEGKAKRFTQSIRAKTEDVTKIPPIPFAYFDPQSESFIVTQSEPIPLAVEPAERMALSQIVESKTAPAITTRLTEVGGGLVANYYDVDAVLRDQSFRPGTPLVAIAAACPLLCLASWLVHRRRDRLRTDPRYARRRSARKRAQQALADAATLKADAVVDAVAAAVLGYVADRCDLATGGLTPAEAAQGLTDRGISDDLVARVRELMNACDTVRYAGGTATADDLVDQARRCIADLERQRF